MKVSVITVTYNNKETIKDSLESVLSQAYGNIEYIVVDGASTDGAVDIIRAYGNRINKFISEPDNGIYDGLNKGILLATGDIVGFLHCDDIYANNEVIKKIVKVFKKYDCDGVYGDLVYLSKNSNKVIRYWKSGEFSIDNLRKGWMPPHPALFLKKKFYEKYGIFDLNF